MCYRDREDYILLWNGLGDTLFCRRKDIDYWWGIKERKLGGLAPCAYFGLYMSRKTLGVKYMGHAIIYTFMCILFGIEVSWMIIW